MHPSLLYIQALIPSSLSHNSKPKISHFSISALRTFQTPTKLIYLSSLSLKNMWKLMGSSPFSKPVARLLVLVQLLLLSDVCLGARKLTSLYQPPPMALTYHGGALLQGDLSVSLLWYGDFSPAQKSIIVDFLLSLNKNPHKDQKAAKPLVTLWWNSVQAYMKKAGQKPTHVSLSTQLSDHNCSVGKNLKRSHISELANGVNSPNSGGGLTLVLTAPDVAVEGFCMSNCGFHDSNQKSNSVFIWVGNSATQCPGQCAWPFHQPIYGPQTPPLVAPNADVGVDGMVVNMATLLAGAVTNPFAHGYYLGSAESPLEAASACTGVYGKGAYPGYAGELLVDSSSGASYNAVGVNGRKYLLPALFDPYTSQCETIV